MCVSEESRAKNMSCAVVALYIIRTGLFLAFFFLSCVPEKKESSFLSLELACWCLCSSSFLFSFFLSVGFIVDSYLLVSFFFMFSPFVVIQESAKRNETEREKEKIYIYIIWALQLTCNAQTKSPMFVHRRNQFELFFLWDNRRWSLLCVRNQWKFLVYSLVI